MDTEDRSKGRTLAIVIGWLILIISVALFYIAAAFILPAFIYGQSMVHVYIIFSIHLLINVGYIVGATFYKPGLMLVALFGWFIPAAFCLYCTFIGIIRGIQHINIENLEEDKFPLFKIVCFSLGFITVYVIAILCYRSVKKATVRREFKLKYEIPKENVEKNESLRLYPTLQVDA